MEKRKKLLLTGDSIIARHEGLKRPMLNAKLNKLMPAVEFTNTAVSGINSGAFFAKINELILDQKLADKLLILLGTNDLATHKQVPLNQFRLNMGLIASAIISFYRPENIFLISPPAVDEKKQQVRSNYLVQLYSKVIKETASEYGFSYIDLCQEMLDHGDLPHLCHGIKNDGLHFGEEGYDLLANLIKKALQ